MHFRNKLALLLLGATLLVSGTATAQTVTYTEGAGSLLTIFKSSVELKVQVRNAQGAPVSGTTVNWAVNGQGLLSTAQSRRMPTESRRANFLLGASSRKRLTRSPLLARRLWA
jgi:hypothetical protein